MDEYPKSQLPRDPEYWEELARGILEDARGRLPPTLHPRRPGTTFWRGAQPG